MLGLLLLMATLAAAQTPPVGPGPDATCVVSALNRNATMQGSYYIIPGVPSTIGVYRVRATCSDGSVGQSALVRDQPGDLLNAGAIAWGNVTPIPLSLSLTIPGSVNFGQSVQLATTAHGMGGATTDVTRLSHGTNYVSSAPWIAQVSADGLMTVEPKPGYAYPTQVVISATNEGTTVSRMIKVGPRGRLSGKVTLADGATVVAGAQVTIELVAPMTGFGTQLTDAAGAFRLADAPAGEYLVKVFDPVSGARAVTTATVGADGATVEVRVSLSGLGEVQVQVLGADGKPVPGARVQLTHAEFQGVFAALQTDALGSAKAAAFLAGKFNVTVVDPASGAVALASGTLANGASAKLTVTLQAVGIIKGRVLSAAGVPQADVQVRLLIEGKGLVSQTMSDANGAFRFDSLPLKDGPYLLQAVNGGVVAGSKGGLALGAPGQQLTQDLVLGTFAAGGLVGGQVIDAQRVPQALVNVTLTTADGRQFSTTTDAQGKYQLSGVPLGSFTVSAVAPNGFTASGAGRIDANGEQVTVDLQLQGLGRVSGIVLLASGAPAADATVTLRSASGAPRRATTDAAGAYRFDNVALARYVLDAIHNASGERVLLNDVLVAPGEAHERPLTLIGMLPLRVFATNGATPAPGVRISVAVRGVLPFGAVAVTDANGVAEFPAVPQGDYSLHADAPGNGYGKHLRLEGTLVPGAPAPSFDMATSHGSFPMYSVAGRVVDGTGAPVAGQWVRLSTRNMPTGNTVPIANNTPDEYLVPTDEQGRFAFSQVFVNDDGRGRIKFDAVVDGLLAGRVIASTLEVAAGTSQDIVLFGSGAIVGHVATRSGRMVPAAPVRLDGADMAVFAADELLASADAHGRYVLPRVPFGTFSVAMVDSARRQLQSEPASLRAEGQVAQLNLSATGDVIVKGSLRAYDGSAMPAAAGIRMELVQKQTGQVLRLYPDDQGGIVAVVDLAPGAYEINAYASNPNGQALVAKRDVTVVAGQDVNVDQRFPATGTLRGTLRYRDGTPLQYGRVQLLPPGAVTPYSVSADAAGAFVFERVVTGPYTLKVALGRYTYEQPIAIAAGQVAVSDAVIPSGTLRGQVRYSSGAPLAYKRLTLSDADGANARSHYLDANGRYQIERVLAGDNLITMVEGMFKLASTVALPDGETVTRDLVVQAGTIEGTLQYAGGLASPRTSLSLVDDNGSSYQSVTTDSLGRFKFADVGAGTYSARTAWPNVPLASNVLVGDQAVVNVNWTLPGAPALTVRVRRANGQPVQGASVSGRFSQELGVTNAAGAVAIGASECAYTRQYSAAYPGLSDVTVSSPDLTPQCDTPREIGLQLPAFASLKIVATVNGGTPLAGARVQALDWRGGQRSLPSTGADGVTLVDALIEGAYTIQVTAPDGSVQKASFNVGLADDGAVLAKPFDFSTAHQRTGKLGFDGERHLWSVPAKAGDRIAVTIHGMDVAGASAIYQVRAEVYTPQKERIAAGYGTGSPFSHYQTNTLADLKQVTAPVDGNYPVAVQAYANGGMGGYQLTVEVNGQPVLAKPYQDGASVKGVVLRGDGVTPAPDQVVELRTGDALALRVRATTDANGGYQFEHVPLSTLNLALYAQDKVVGGAQAELTDAGQVLLQDLMLLLTTLDISVSVDPALPLPAQMFVQLSDVSGSREVGPIVFEGNRTSKVFSIVAAGDNITVSATYPGNGLVNTSQVVAAADGQRVPVQLVLQVVGVSGKVIAADGQGVPGATVYAYTLYDHGYVGAASANEYGEYIIAGLPTGVELLLSAYNPINGVTSSLKVAALSTPNLGGQDIRFPALGSISGTTVYTSGAPLGKVRIIVSGYLPYSEATPRLAKGTAIVNATTMLATGKVIANATTVPTADPFALNVRTGADGSYQIDNVPVGVELRVTATPPGGYGEEQEQSARLASANQALALPAFVFDRGPLLTIKLLDGDRQENALLFKPSIGECGSNFVELTTSAGVRRFYVGDNVELGEGGNEAMGEGPMQQLPPLTGLPKGIAKLAFFDGCSDNAPLATASVDIAGDGDYEVELLVQIVTGKVTYAAGGAPRWFGASLVQTTPEGGERWFYNVVDTYANSGGGFAFVGVAPGPFTIHVNDHLGSSEVSQSGIMGATGNQNVDVVLTFTGPARIQGRVTYGDQSPVPFANMVLYQTGEVRHTTADETGWYGFDAHNMRAGAFELTAQDPQSGVTVSASGTAVNGVLSTVDLSLPVAGTVTGTLVDADGNPVAYADVLLNSASAAGFNASGSTDEQGRFRFERVGLGRFSVLAQAPGTKLVAMTSGIIDANGQEVELTLAQPRGATVTGYVRSAGAPVPGARVVFETAQSFGPFGALTLSVDADGDGRFTVALAQPGAFRLSASNGAAAPLRGIAAGVVADGATAELDVALGNALALPFVLTGADGHAYGVSCEGGIQNGARPFGQLAYALTVDGVALPCAGVVAASADERELRFGPTALGDGTLAASRRVFSPAAGGFVRFIDTFVNSASDEVTVTVQVGGNSMLYYAPLVVDPQNNQQRFAVFGEPAFAGVFGGAGGAPNPDQTFGYEATLGTGDGDTRTGYQWSIKVPAGGKVSLMHFVLLAAGTSEAQIAAGMLSNNAATSMFEGIAPEDKAAIINFQVP